MPYNTIIVCNKVNKLLCFIFVNNLNIYISKGCRKSMDFILLIESMRLNFCLRFYFLGKKLLLSIIKKVIFDRFILCERDPPEKKINNNKKNKSFCYNSKSFLINFN